MMPSPTQMLIVLLVVLLVFGTKKLRNVGGDLGAAMRSFKRGLSGEEDAQDKDPPKLEADPPAQAETHTESDQAKRS